MIEAPALESKQIAEKESPEAIHQKEVQIQEIIHHEQSRLINPAEEYTAGEATEFTTTAQEVLVPPETVLREASDIVQEEASLPPAGYIYDDIVQNTTTALSEEAVPEDSFIPETEFAQALTDNEQIDAEAIDRGYIADRMVETIDDIAATLPELPSIDVLEDDELAEFRKVIRESYTINHEEILESEETSYELIRSKFEDEETESVGITSADPLLEKPEDDELAEFRKVIRESYTINAVETPELEETSPELVDIKFESEEKESVNVTSADQLLEEPESTLENVALEILKLDEEAIVPAKDALLEVTDSISSYRSHRDELKEIDDPGQIHELEAELKVEIEEVTEQLIKVLDNLDIGYTPDEVEQIIQSLIEGAGPESNQAIRILLQEGAHEALQDNHLLRQLAQKIQNKLPLHLSLGKFALKTAAA